MKASDAVIRRFDKDIPDSIRDDADFYFVKERWCVPDTPSKWRLNTGVYVMRNCPSSRQLLDAAISRREYINHEWWDQAAISAVLGYWSVFFRPEEHRPDEPTEISKRIGWLHSEWNASPVYDPEPNAIIHHFYGLRGNGKKVAMMIDAIADGRAEGSSPSAPVTIGQIFKLLEPSLRAGLSAPTGCDHDVDAGLRALRKKPWRLWTSQSWATRQFVRAGLKKP